MKLRTATERIREIEDKCVLYNIEKFVSKIFQEKTNKNRKKMGSCSTSTYFSRGHSPANHQTGRWSNQLQTSDNTIRSIIYQGNTKYMYTRAYNMIHIIQAKGKLTENKLHDECCNKNVPCNS